MADEPVSELDPPGPEHPRVTTARVWPVLDHWRYDVQHPGPPRSRSSGETRTENAALLAAADELIRLANRRL